MTVLGFTVWKFPANQENADKTNGAQRGKSRIYFRSIWKQKLNISGQHNNQHNKIKHSLCQIWNPRSTIPKADGHLGLDISHICLLYRIWVLSITWIYNWDYKIAC